MDNILATSHHHPVLHEEVMILTNDGQSDYNSFGQ